MSERLAVLSRPVIEAAGLQEDSCDSLYDSLLTAYLQEVLLPLEVDGDAVVVLGRGVLTHDVREQVHLGVLLRQLE